MFSEQPVKQAYELLYENAMTRPSIYDYVDYRAYLKDLIDYHRPLGEFSFSKFAERAGFKSRGYLIEVIAGKRNLSSEAFNKIVVGLNLNFQEGESFKALAQYNQAKTFDDQKYYWESFLDNRPRNSRSKQIRDTYKYLAKPFYPYLPVIIKQPHIRKTPKELARLCDVTLKEIKEGIETLKNLGLIREIAPEEYIALPATVTTTNDIPNIAIQSFHANMLAKAKTCLSLPVDEREYQTQFLALSKERLIFLKTKIRELMEEMAEKFDSSRVGSEKLYALNVNLIPITPDFVFGCETKKGEKP